MSLNYSQEAIPWCNKYLTEGEPTPYAHIRNAMRVVSSAVRNGRKTAQIRWLSDTSLWLNGKVIDLDVYSSFVRFQLDYLETFIRDKILFGETLEKLGIDIDFTKLNDNGDVETMGYGPILSTAELSLKSNGDAQKLFDKLEECGMIKRSDDGVKWDLLEAELWIANIHKAVSFLQILVHISQGSAGRCTEETKMQCTNSSVGRRHLFVTPGLNTLCIWSNYWKGTTKAGTIKEVLRVLPYQVSRLVFVMVRLVRPVSLFYIARHTVLASARPALLSTYSTMLWATLASSLNATQIYDNCVSFFASPYRDRPSPFEFELGTRMHRQFVVAVQRKTIPKSPLYSPTMSGVSIGDLQAGRSAQTLQQNYAVEQCTISREKEFIEHYIFYSQLWHKFLGIPTEGSKDARYNV